jgi:hypothetical protein
MVIVYSLLAFIAAVLTIFFVYKSRNFRKFLAGAFFVSSGIQFYLFLANVSIPLLGTDYVQTPTLSGIRSSIHFLFFALCFYFGFIKKPMKSK